MLCFGYTNNVMKILIAGAGIGGLTLGAFLKDSNIEYEIVDKVIDWDHQGYSLALWNNGRHILQKLGLAEKFDDAGSRIQTYEIYDGKGTLLRKYNLSDFYGTYGIALTLVNRSDIHQWLLRKVRKETIALGTSLKSIKQTEKNVEVTFTSNKIKHYDLVVGADGIHSLVRHLVFHDSIKSASTWRVWWAWIDNTYKTKGMVKEYIEAGEFFAIFDSGEKTLAIVAALNSNLRWNSVEKKAQKLMDIFHDEKKLSPQVFASLKNEDIVSSELTHIQLNTWVKDTVVLLGDAAHGFEPHGGIGGSMALEDGYVLAAELMKVSEKYPLSEALKQYETQRRKRVNKAYKLTYKMKTWALVKSKILRKLINIITPYFPESFFVNDYHALMKEEI